MKTKQFKKKLTLNKTTVSDLNRKQMNLIQGAGSVDSCAHTCVFSCTCRTWWNSCPDCQPDPEPNDPTNEPFE